MVRRGPGGLFRIHAVVGVLGLGQAILLPAPCQKLPHAAGGLARNRARDEARLGLGQMNQFLGYAFFIQNALNHGTVPACPLHARHQRPPTPAVEKVDVSQNRVGYLQGQLRHGGRHLLPNFVLEPGIDGKGHLENIFEGGSFEPGLLHLDGSAQASQIEPMYGIDHFIQAFFVVLTILQIRIRGVEHQINCAVKFVARAGRVVSLVEPFSALKRLVRLLH